MKPKNTAILLSLLLPGLGHVRLRKYFDGIALGVVTVFVWVVVYFIGTSMNVFSGRAAVITLALIFLYAYSIYDVVRLTRKSKN